MNSEFIGWLAAVDTSICHLQHFGRIFLFVREAKSPQFDYLFSVHYSEQSGIGRGCSMEYAGIYCRQDGLLYDGNSDLKVITGSDMQTRTPAYLREVLQEDVRRITEKRLDNDRSRLNITEVMDYTLRDRLKHYQEYYGKEEARRAYLDTAAFESPVYRCDYVPERWTEDSLLAYILGPEEYAEKEADTFIADNQEKILLDFLCNDALIAHYEALVAEKDNQVHIVKNIMRAVNASSAKTVNVTVRKNNLEFTFKTEASEFRRDCTTKYNSWNIVAADRRKFESLFGKYADYLPHEVLCITYGKNVLYQL